MGENGLHTIPLKQYAVRIIYWKNNSGSTLRTWTKFPVLGKVCHFSRFRLPLCGITQSCAGTCGVFLSSSTVELCSQTGQ